MKIICSDCDLLFENISDFQEHCYQMKKIRNPDSRVLSFYKGITLLFFALFLSGCIPGITSSNVKHLSPEQIKELRESKQDFISCFTLGGPAIAGRTSILTYPPGKTPSTLKFGSNCEILNQ